MKLAAGEVEGFVERPRPGVALALLYGPDAGLVSERAKHLGTRIVPDLADPFRVTELDGDQLEGAGGRLLEEAQALCLTGGQRLVRVRNASDSLADACRALLAEPAVAAFVVLEAGDLGPASSLRRLAEAGRQAVALPCYRAEAGSLRAAVEGQLKAHGLEPSREAMAWLLEHLGGDHALTRNEIDKLALYLADAPSRRVTLEDAAAVLGDSSALSIDEVVQAAVLGDLARLDRRLDRCLAEGVHPGRILRATSFLLLRLLRLQAERADGRAPEAVVAAARPPIFFRLREFHVAALRRWPADRLMRALATLHQAEDLSRRTAAPEALLCRQVLRQLGAVVAPPLTARPQSR